MFEHVVSDPRTLEAGSMGLGGASIDMACSSTSCGRLIGLESEV